MDTFDEVLEALARIQAENERVRNWGAETAPDESEETD